MLETIYSFLVLVFSIVIHEVAHGWMAYRLGDPTAKYQGRLSLNPMAHIDPLGSVLFPIFALILTRGQGPVFGWAKPVPINPYNFRDQKWGQLKAALAGPLSNIVIALISGLLIRFLPLHEIVLLPLSVICLTNLSLAIFNLAPVPPLDGSHIVLSFFPAQASKIEAFFQRYGFLILLLFIFFAADFIGPLVTRVFYLIVGF